MHIVVSPFAFQEQTQFIFLNLEPTYTFRNQVSSVKEHDEPKCTDRFGTFMYGRLLRLDAAWAFCTLQLVTNQYLELNRIHLPPDLKIPALINIKSSIS